MFWYFWVNKTSKQVWILDSRSSLDEYILITANTLVLKYTMKYFKALELVFYVIPADKISWMEKWHFAPLCSVGADAVPRQHHWVTNGVAGMRSRATHATMLATSF